MPKYRVEFAHEDENADEALRHGPGSIEITTDLPITTDAEKYEVARAIGLELGKTKIVIKQIIPLETGEVVIDYADLLTEDSKKILEDNTEVYEITSLPAKDDE